MCRMDGSWHKWNRGEKFILLRMVHHIPGSAFICAGICMFSVKKTFETFIQSSEWDGEQESLCKFRKWFFFSSSSFHFTGSQYLLKHGRESRDERKIGNL